MKLIYLIRHGETEFNRLKIVQGSGVDKELNEKGHWQASQFFKTYQDVPFEHIYVSALQRTQQSVSSFFNKGIPTTILPELNEISWGVFEGKQQSEEERQHYWEVVQSWKNGNIDAKIDKGESARELQERITKAISQILLGQAQTILVCMHGRAMKCFLCTILNLPLTEMEKFEHTNLGLYVISQNGNGQFELLKRNDSAHLFA